MAKCIGHIFDGRPGGSWRCERCGMLYSDRLKELEAHPMNKGSDAPQLADDLERLADNTLKSADWFWGWRSRDRKISIAFGQLSRDLRVVATRVRALTKVEE